MMQSITLIIDYGDDSESVELGRSLYNAFKSGQVVSFDGQEFVYDDEGLQDDRWVLDGHHFVSRGAL